MKYDIYKSGGIIIHDRKLLLTKPSDKPFYIAPGGTIEDGETPLECLVRELKEELTIDIIESDALFWETFYAPAAGRENSILRMDVFLINSWRGSIIPDQEIEAIAWATSQTPRGYDVGSIFEHDVIPKLKAQNLID